MHLKYRTSHANIRVSNDSIVCKVTSHRATNFSIKNRTHTTLYRTYDTIERSCKSMSQYWNHVPTTFESRIRLARVIYCFPDKRIKCACNTDAKRQRALITLFAQFRDNGHYITGFVREKALIWITVESYYIIAALPEQFYRTINILMHLWIDKLHTRRYTMYCVHLISLSRLVAMCSRGWKSNFASKIGVFWLCRVNPLMVVCTVRYTRPISQ